LEDSLSNSKPPLKPDSSLAYCFPLGQYQGFQRRRQDAYVFRKYVGRAMKRLFEKYQDMGIPEDVYDRSIAYGDSVAKHVLSLFG
jgi:hypothetical protein